MGEDETERRSWDGRRGMKVKESTGVDGWSVDPPSPGKQILDLFLTSPPFRPGELLLVPRLCDRRRRESGKI